MKQYILSLALIFTISVNLFAQNGTIRGIVIDDETGETIMGASIFLPQVEGVGTISDLDGSFSLSVKPGKYTLNISFTGLSTLTMTDVAVVAGETNVLGELRLKESSDVLVEVVVSATAKRNTESAILTLKRKSAVVMDGISSSLIREIGDNNAVEAAKRITGVTVEGGKYVYVRGLGDRYSKTTLNDMEIPGLDPDKNSIQMDLFPTSLVDNITVVKTFSADKPADFSGGLLNLEIKSFPDKKVFEYSAGIGINPSMHFNNDYLTYQGGGLDFLGFDNGTRALPEGASGSNIPTPISGASPDQVNAFVNSFDPNLGAQQKMSFMDFSFNVSMGNQIDLKNKINSKLGYVFSLAYKNETRYYDDVIYGEYQRYQDPERYDLRYATVQNGQLGENGVLVGAMAGVAYKTTRSKHRLNLIHLQSGEKKAGQFWIDNDGEAVGQSGYIGFSNNLEYNQRSLTNLLLNGSYYLNDDKLEIDWRIAPTYSNGTDPDIRRTAFTYTAVDTNFNAGAAGNPTRIWRNLSEVNLPVKVDFTRKATLFNRDAEWKAGVSNIYKMRDYRILSYDVQFFGNQPNWAEPDPDIVLDPEQIYPNGRIYYSSGNADPNPNEYQSSSNNTALYVSGEFKPNTLLKAVVGLRAENFTQWHTGRDQRYASGDVVNGRSLDNEVVLESFNLFPSVNLIYSVTRLQNLRASYSRTIARPSFKELSFAQILDPITNRIFNGSLFTYSDWDGKLQVTNIDNLDLRWELFNEDGEMVSVSAFYKNFTNPIELVRIPEQQTSTEYQPRNVGNGQLYGLELEFRKDLDFISEKLKNFNLSGNFTFVESFIDMTDLEFNSRVNFEKKGQTIVNRRSMAGQSPYVLNGGIAYKDEEKGISGGLFYNVKGPTLQIVGVGLFPDIYTIPFHSLNFNMNKKLGKEQGTGLSIGISNLLMDRVESMFRSYEAGDQPFNSIAPGMSFSIGISHKI
ncbi:MAG: TonB-dependent receptor [Flavobacteriales bacterium]|nr:TonB-dependent receptor [Flavobacteriales bacterium]